MYHFNRALVKCLGYSKLSPSLSYYYYVNYHGFYHLTTPNPYFYIFFICAFNLWSSGCLRAKANTTYSKKRNKNWPIRNKRQQKVVTNLGLRNEEAKSQEEKQRIRWAQQLILAAGPLRSPFWSPNSLSLMPHRKGGAGPPLLWERPVRKNSGGANQPIHSSQHLSLINSKNPTADYFFPARSCY